MTPLTASRMLRRRGEDTTDATKVDPATDEPMDATGVPTESASVEKTSPADTAPPDANTDEPGPRPRRSSAIGWRRLVTIALTAIALVLACGAGYLKWDQATVGDDARAASEAVRAASENTVAILSYKADSVENDLGAASGRLTGEFRSSYDSLTHDVVIPGARERQISSTATVPAAAAMSASENHAVVLLFVNQTVTMGDTAPSDTASSVKVTLDKQDGRWLISGFDPV